ncbi:ribonuclease D [Pontibacter sp. KCTC 32443]|uniref:ribonuclease D n=1 Tax=Pontibacter TaxID=323449 RepID=UPI00164CEEE2|nr:MULTISPECIES: ribonuclease D [Pontibacter]MBC5776027.1 ribonuclease D [Pontibacter sp. KCTC 32443]
MEFTTLSNNNITIKLVSTTDELRNAVSDLSASQELALDLEFDQNRFTYGFNLCLIQVTAGNGVCYIIDPFEIPDLQPFFSLMENEAIVKIIHHSNNDILLLDKMGCRIRNVMDTDVAAKILNYERSSLATVLKEEFEIEIDKSQQSSNWNKRPLTEQQLQYAAIDVVYLHQVKDKLLAEIERVGRMHWLAEENALLENLRYTESENPHLRLRNASRLTFYDQFILKALYQFRENLGKNLNKPAPYIIPNDALVELASQPDVDIHEWLNHTKGIHGRLKSPKYESKLSEAIVKVKKAAVEQQISHDYPTNQFRRPYRTPETESRKEELTKVQAEIVKQYGEFAGRLIINQSLINEYSYTGKLRCTKKYATTIVLETAASLGIALPQPETGGSAA